MKGRQVSRRRFLKLMGAASGALAGASLFQLMPKGAQGPRCGGQLILSLGTDVPIFDSVYAHGIPNLGIICLVSETTTRINPEGKDPKVLPLLAESWTPNGRTWRFSLRKGVKFHDGTPFNAEAIKFNIERMLNPETKALARAAFTMIESVTVVDEYTVDITTAEGPFAGLPAQLAYSPMAINSPTQVQKLGNKDYHKAPVGTGPFKFVHHIKDQEVFLEANAEYWDGKPYLESFIMKPIPETASRIMALEAGEIHVAYHVPPRDAKRFIDNPGLGIDVLTPPPQRRMFIGMNVQWGPLKDQRVRQALNYAVDKQAIVNNIFLGGAVNRSRVGGGKLGVEGRGDAQKESFGGDGTLTQGTRDHPAGANERRVGRSGPLPLHEGVKHPTGGPGPPTAGRQGEPRSGLEVDPQVQL